MRKSNKKLLAGILSATLIVSTMLTGCGGGNDSNNTPETTESTQPDNGTESTEDNNADDTKEESNAEPEGEETLAAEQVLNSFQPSAYQFDTTKVQDAESSTLALATQEGLFRAYTEDNGSTTLQEAGCESYELSEDSLTYTFHIRENTWSDGMPVTAQHYADAIYRVLDPETASSYAFFAYGIKNGEAYYNGKAKKKDIGIEVPDDKTLVITLDAPDPTFLNKISYTVFNPIRMDIVEKYGDAYGTSTDQLVFSGPFVIDEWVSEQAAVLLKNESYWDAENVKLTQINLYTVKELSTRDQMFQSDELSHTGASQEYLEQYRQQAEQGEFKYLHRDAAGSLFWLTYNMDGGKSGLMSNAKIRKAVGYALNNKEYVETIYGRFTPAYSLIPPNIMCGDTLYRESVPELWQSESEQYRNQPEKLQQLFKEGLEELNMDTDLSKVKLTYLTYGESSLEKQVQEFIKQSVESNLGITLEMQIEGDWGLYSSEVAGKDWDVSLNGWSPDYNDPLTYLDIFVSGGSSNYQRYNNSEYDKLVEQLKSESDLTKRMELSETLETMLRDDVVLTPIYYTDVNTFIHNNVKGLQVPVFGGNFDYKYAYIVEE